MPHPNPSLKGREKKAYPQPLPEGKGAWIARERSLPRPLPKGKGVWIARRISSGVRRRGRLAVIIMLRDERIPFVAGGNNPTPQISGERMDK